MRQRILIIDDNIIFCNAIKYHLQQHGYYVETCFSQNEFQDKSKTDIELFDFILLDLRLQNEEGFDILRRILDIDQDKKVIIISSYLDNQSISKAQRLGAYKCLNKSSDLFKELDRVIMKSKGE